MFRFTIRDVLWLTVVVAMGVVWFTSRSEIGQLRSRLEGATARETSLSEELHARRLQVKNERARYVKMLRTFGQSPDQISN